MAEIALAAVERGVARRIVQSDIETAHHFELGDAERIILPRDLPDAVGKSRAEARAQSMVRP